MRQFPPRSALTISGGGRTVSWLLDMRAEQAPNRRFFVWEPFAGPSRAFSYAEFARAVARVAGGLSRRGILRGDKALIYLDNCPELLLTWFACLRLGAVAVFANTRSAPDELRYCAEHSGAIAAVTQPSYAATVAAALPAARAMIVTSYDPTDVRGVSVNNGRDHSFDELLSAEEMRAEPCPALAAAYVLYTSGTTGRPKGVIWTHANAMWAAKVNAAHEGLTASDVHLICLPLFHINAQAYGVLASMWAGASFVLQPRFSASRFWEVSVANRCTWASQIYFSLRTLATKEFPANHFYRLWGTGVCGHPLGTKFGVPTIGWWGMTETISHPIVGELQVPNRPQTIGHAAAEYEVAVVDETGRPVDVGETGELLVRGTPGVSLFGGYLRDAEATANAFDADGWFKSGDRVTVYADGAFTFADRAKDMLKIGAENVAASEIERVVITVPGVREVAVVGAPDSMLEEVPVAFVVAAGGHPDLETTILNACRRNLADFKVPRAIRIVGDLPRSTLEKVAKHKLRELLRTEAQQPPK
jgi:crotonobetaine/carnitine-CoA ligase